MYQFVKWFLEEKVGTNQTGIFSQCTHVGILHSGIFLIFFFVSEYILLMIKIMMILLLTFFLLRENVLMRMMFNLNTDYDDIESLLWKSQWNLLSLSFVELTNETIERENFCWANKNSRIQIIWFKDVMMNWEGTRQT